MSRLLYRVALDLSSEVTTLELGEYGISRITSASTLVDGGRKKIVNLFFFSFSLWERRILDPLPEQSNQGSKPHPEVEDRVYVS